LFVNVTPVTYLSCVLKDDKSAVYADNLFISGVSLGLSSDGINLFTSSLKDALETTGSNLTVKGNLLVKGTTTAINSTTVAIGDNVIELNGTSKQLRKLKR
jgi:hypothetical protein